MGPLIQQDGQWHRAWIRYFCQKPTEPGPYSTVNLFFCPKPNRDGHGFKMNHWVCVTHRLFVTMVTASFFFLSTCPIRQLRHEVWRDRLPSAAKTDLLYKGGKSEILLLLLQPLWKWLQPVYCRYACAAFGAPRKWPSKGDAAGCPDTHPTINDPPVEKLQKQCVWCVSSGDVTEITNPKQRTRQREGFYFNSTLHFYWKVAESHLNPKIILQYLFEPGPSRVGGRYSALTLNGLFTTEGF